MPSRTALRRRLKAHYSQIGKSMKAIDKLLVAKKVGWRRSKSGHRYFENRRNRSDVSRKRRL
jgi:hypothetical protein